MTVGSFLSSININDHTSEAKYPDGSGGQDRYVLVICCNGHGRLMSAQVKRANVSQGMMFVNADGTSKKTKSAPAPEDSRDEGWQDPLKEASGLLEIL